MNNVAREKARQRADNIRASKAQKAQRRARRDSPPDESLTKLLAQQTNRLTDDALFPSVGKPLFASVHSLRGQNDSAIIPYHELLKRVARVAPKLIEPEYVAAIYWLARVPHVRPVEDWEPRGHGRDTLFRSLAVHLLCQYPTPPFLWSVCFADSDSASTLLPVVANIAKGGSLYQAVQSEAFPIPFPRKLCHEFLRSSSQLGIIEAIRFTQVKAAGGSKRLHQALMGTELGRCVLSRTDEAFWATVIDWFGRQGPLFDPTQIGPLVDYIRHRRHENIAFSMKGRVPNALLRDMDQWHGELAPQKKTHGAIFKPSGIRGGTYDQSHRDSGGNFVIQIWTVREILTNKELAAEGRDQKHCVLSYACQVENGQTSIWSMTVEDMMGQKRALTMEVYNAGRRIVQIRGKLNRMATAAEMRVVRMWAAENNLRIEMSSW